MKISDLISKLEQSGISVQLVDNKLKAKARKGKITEAQLKEIRANKEKIIRFLREVAASQFLSEIKPAGLKEYYDLSHAQKRLWVFSQLNPDSPVYNMPAAYYFNGDFDREAFQKALKKLVSRHEILRTTFLKINGEPKQKVNSIGNLGFDVGYIDLRKHEGKESVQNIINDEAFRPFNLEKGPLLRAKLIHLGEKKYAFIFCIHHIIADEWSLEIFVSEALQLYKACRQNKDYENLLQPLKIQYKDYAAWQNDEISGGPFEKYRKYWLTLFNDEIPALNLPVDFPRPERRTYRGDHFQFELTAKQAGLLKNLCKRYEVSLFIGITAWIKALMHHYTGQEDVIIGAPVAGREHPDLADQIGFYVNLIALRTKFKGEESFQKLLLKVKDAVFGAFSHQIYPFDCLVEELNLKNDSERPALFDIGFTWHSKAMIESSTPDVDHKVEKQELSFNMAKYDLWFHGLERQNTISFNIEYNTDLFTASRIKSMAEHFTILLESIAGNPSVPVQKLEYMTSEEQKLVIERFNATQKEFSLKSTIHQLFEDQVRKTPDAAAVVYRDTVLSYRELNREANKLAHYLKNQYQIGVDDVVGLMVGRSEKAIIGILGILKAGGAYLPVDPEHPKERSRYMLTNSGVKALLTDSEYMLAGMEYFNGDIFILDIQLSDLTTSTDNPLHESKPADLAYVIYTSGSTGSPKGVAVEHRGYINMCFDQIERYKVSSKDNVLQFASLSFDASVFEIFIALLSGASLTLIDKNAINHAGQFTEFIQNKAISLVLLPPVYLNGLDLDKLKTLRVLITGGESPNIHDALYCCQCSLYFNAYGPTECAVIAAVQQVTGKEEEKENIPIGRPVANMQIYILNEGLQPVAIGIPGEICISGAGLARGYIGQEKLTKETFVSHPFRTGERLYRTGDLGRWRADGAIEILGRKDAQVKIRGFRIELGEIENTLSAYEAVKDAHVIVKEDAKKDKKLIAYYTAAASIDEGVLKSYLKHQLPSYMTPSYFIRLESFPVNNSGKVDLKRLPAPQGFNRGALETYTPPKSKPEKQLAKIWEEVLGKEMVGAGDNFFAIGGDSIKAIRIVSAVEKQLGKTIDIKDIFNHQEICALAEVLESAVVKNKGGYSEEAYNDAVKDLDKFKEQVVSQPNFNELVGSGWEKVYPMSDIEEGMVFHSLLGDSYYFEQVYYRIQDPSFSYDLFCRAFMALVEKHDKLRSSFYMNEFGSPTQIVHKFSSFSPDIKMKSFSDQNGALETYLKKEREIPFDLKRPGLWRLRILDFGAEEYGILFIVHHAIIDGWSNASLVTELSNVYTALKDNIDYQLQPLKATYKDYIIDQMLLRKSEEAHAFWKNYLNGYKRTDIPLNKALPAQPVKEDPELFFLSLNNRLTEALIQRSAELKVNVKDILLAAFTYLIKLTTNSNEVVFGLVTNGRPVIEDGDKIIGCFLNSVPFRFNVDYGITGEQLVNQVAGSSHKLKSYDKLSLIKIANLVEQGSAYHAPIYDILFNYTDFHITQNANENIILKEASIYEKINTAFNIIIIRSGDQIGFRFNYSQGLYNAEEIKRIGQYLIKLLEMIAFEPQNPIVSAKIIPPQEAKRLFSDFNGKRRIDAKSETIHEAFESQAAKTPGKTAVVYEDRSLTYKELNEAANRLARYIRSNYHIKPDDLIGIMLPRSEKMVVALLAILKCGAAYVPIESSFPAQRKKRMISDCAIKLLLTGSTLMFDVAEFYDGPLFVMDIEFDSLPHNNLNLPNTSGRRNLAYVMYTSGSTGVPKGVMAEHRNIIRLVDNEAVLKTNANLKLLQTGALSFDASTFEIWGMLLKGGELHFLSQEKLLSIEEMRAKIFRDKITIMWLTSSWFNRLADTDISVFNTLKYLIVGGEQLSPRHIKKVKLKFPQLIIINGYGPTEAVTFTTFYEIKNNFNFQFSIPIGSPLDNTSVYILDEDFEPAPMGVVGEIYIGGEGVARGYLNKKDSTAEKFLRIVSISESYLYRTGDLGRWGPDGNIEFKGRKDSQVKIRGYRIELDEIAHVMLQHSDLAQVHVKIVSNDKGEKEIAAYYTLKSQGTDEHLNKYLDTHLPAFMKPNHLICLENMPLNKNGKLDQTQLPKIEELENGKQKTYLPPRNATEEKLVEIWEEVLGKDTVGVKDNFFDLGGHSLRATQVMYYIHKKFNKKIQLNDIFNHPTIESLAKIIANNNNDDFKEILPLEKKDYYDLSHSQKRLWLLMQTGSNQIAYNMPMAFILEGPLELTALEKSFKKLISRHEILRTVFVTIEGEPKQKVLTEGELGFNINFIDLQDERDKEDFVKNYLNKESEWVFDLENGPMIRAGLLRIEPGKYIFCCNMHHIISDGWSMGVIINEVTLFYNTFIQNEKVDIRPLAIHYKDHAAWQNEQLNENRLNRYRDYWIEQFNDNIPALDLPLDYKRPSQRTYEGDYVGFKINAEVSGALYEISQRTSASLFMTLLACAKILLYKYSGQKDIIVGTPIAGREHMALENQIGFYLNTLPLRTKLQGGERFIDLLERVKHMTLESYERQIYPFDRLIEDLNLDVDRSRSPLFDVMVVLNNMDFNVQNASVFNGLKVTRYGDETDHKTSKYDLSFFFKEHNGKILGNINYNTNLFKKVAIQKFRDYLIYIISSVAQNANMTIAEMEMGGTEEEEKFKAFTS